MNFIDRAIKRIQKAYETKPPCEHLMAKFESTSDIKILDLSGNIEHIRGKTESWTQCIRCGMRTNP